MYDHSFTYGCGNKHRIRVSVPPTGDLGPAFSSLARLVGAAVIVRALTALSWRRQKLREHRAPTDPVREAGTAICAKGAPSSDPPDAAGEAVLGVSRVVEELGTIGIKSVEVDRGAVRGSPAETALTHVACSSMAETPPVHSIRIKAHTAGPLYSSQ